MTAQLILRGIRVQVQIGITPEERRTPQPLVISLVIDMGFAPAVNTDRLEDTIDYVRVISHVRAFSERFDGETIEYYANQLGLQLMKSFSSAVSVDITVSKPRFTGELQLDAIEIRVCH